MPIKTVLPKSLKEMLPASVHFMYSRFARELNEIEEQIAYYEEMHETGRIVYSDIVELEIALEKIYDVAGMLGLSKDLLDQMQEEDKKGIN